MGGSGPKSTTDIFQIIAQLITKVNAIKAQANCKKNKFKCAIQVLDGISHAFSLDQLRGTIFWEDVIKKELTELLSITSSSHSPKVNPLDQDKKTYLIICI